MNWEPCKYCESQFPVDEEQCPHCGRPSLFPNVKLANREEERQALDERYQAVQEAGEQRGAQKALDAFEKALESSMAVINRSLEETDHLVARQNQKESEFPRCLLRPGDQGEDDDFIEVHIGGPMTGRTLRKVLLPERWSSGARGKALREKLRAQEVEMEAQS